MAPSEPSDASTASSSSNIALLPEEKIKYENFIKNYSAMRSITEAPIIPAGLFYKPNSESNPLVISDDSKDDFDQPLVVLIPIEPSDFEAAWDLLNLHTEQIVDNNEANLTSSTNRDNTTKEYSMNCGFVFDDVMQNVYLHNIDPDFAPGSVGSREGSSESGEDNSADDDDGKPPANMERRGSADF